MKGRYFVFFLFFTGCTLTKGLNGCKKKFYSKDRMVCVCDSGYCDDIPSIEPLSTNEAAVFVSSQSGFRLERSLVRWSPVRRRKPAYAVSVVVNPAQVFQQIFGFGGAFTDAAGINIASLSEKSQQNLLSSYFGEKGLRYTIGRVPMASCDFSTREYSYDDRAGDLNLNNFKLAAEDVKFKIPFIHDAQKLSGWKIKMFASPWSAPGWMKTNGKMNGNGTLRGLPGGKYYKAWAQYFVKFLQSYQSENITFWAVTAQNEPTTGYIYNYSWQTMGFTKEHERDFIKMDLGPALRKFGFDKVKIIILDDVRLMLPQWANTVLGDPVARQYVSGIGIHWYMDWLVPAKVLSQTHKLHPEVFILATEACHMGAPVLGSWETAELYAYDIITDLNHWTVGWTDWNLALDPEGGPNWVKNFVDSPIIVNKTADEFYKQPMFYALAHFSVFVPPASKRIGIKIKPWSSLLSVTAFSTPSRKRILVILNSGQKNLTLKISEDRKRNKELVFTAKARSLTTVVWKKN